MSKMHSTGPGFIDAEVDQPDFRSIEAQERSALQAAAEAHAAKNMKMAKGFGAFGLGITLLAAFFLFVFSLDAIATLTTIFAANKWLGWGATVLLALALLALGYAILRELAAGARLRRTLREAEKSKQSQQHQTITPRDIDAALGHVHRLAKLRDHPCSSQLQKALLDLKDIKQSGQSLESQMHLIETLALRPLDIEVQRHVRHGFATTTWTTIASPFAILDAGLTLHRALVMSRRIAYIYAGVPSSFASTILIRKTFGAMVIAGTMEASDALLTNLLGGGLVARMSAKLGEGVVAGVMIARLGLAAQRLLRPQPFVTQRQPTLADMTPDLIENLINTKEQR